MKTEIDSTELSASAAEGSTATTAGAESKVFRRLELFALQRGYRVDTELAEALGTAPEAGLAYAKPKSGKAKGKGAKKSAAPDASDAAVAQMYVDACAALPGPGADAPKGASPPIETTRRTGSGPHWQLIGPRLVPEGQTYGSGRADVSGRVSSIAIDPSDPSHILCGSAGGGIWESRNTGSTWSPRSDHMPTLTTGALAFDPSSPNIVYAGTGEGDAMAGLGAGLMRSTNGGTTWSMRATAPFVGAGFYSLVVNPSNGQHLLSGTRIGLHVSTNGGATWQRRRTARTWVVSMAGGGTSAEILAACSDGLFRSTNGGTSWSRVNLPGAPATWSRLAVDHVAGDSRIAYAFGAGGGAAFLYRRSASGTWSRISTPSNLGTNQAWYDWYVAAAPDRTNQVYVGAINVFRGDRSGSTWTWTALSAKTSGDSIHPDQHAMAFHPTNANIIYAGNDGGLYRSTNRGINWTSLNTGLAITEFEYIDHDPGSSRWLMGGTQDNGTNRYHGSTILDHIADGDGGDCAVNYSNPDTVYHSFYRMGIERSDDRGNMGTWQWIPWASRDTSIYRQLFYPPMECNGNTVAQAGETVVVSRNSGNSPVHVDSPGRPWASAMHMPSPNRIYVGITSGRIYRITWNGSSWSSAVALSTPRLNAWVSDIYVNPSNTNRMWATYTTINGGPVFRSDNGGSSWSDRSAGLPALPINSIAVHPTNQNRVCVAADVGVYESRDGGASWRPFSSGLPNAIVSDLRYHQHSRLLRAATKNRSIWQIHVDGKLRQPICGRQFTGTVPANSTRRWFTHSWPAPWHVIWTVMPTTIESGARQLKWNVQVERANAEFATYWISVTNRTGRAVSFEGRYCITSFA